MHLLFSFPFYMHFFPLRKYKMLMGELTIPHTVNQFLGQYVTGNVQ